MDDAFETTDPKRRRVLGVLVMAGIALLQLATEYLGTHDAGRFLSKAIALLVGLPLLIVWAFAVFRWASRKRFGALGPLFVGAVAAGLFFAGLLWATRAASLSIPPLRPHYGPWGGADVLRVGFAMGLTSFALWALAFVFPFAVEDARVRALEADKLRTLAELARLRAREYWLLVNDSDECHNFHIHQTKFVVLDADFGAEGARTSATQCLGDRGFVPPVNRNLLHDTYPLPPRARVFVMIKFDGPKFGRFVFHCHILEHEDKGMMATIGVVDSPPR